MDTNEVIDTGIALYGQKIYIQSSGNKEKDEKNAGRIKETLECYVDRISHSTNNDPKHDFLAEGLDDPLHSLPSNNITYYGPESDEVYRDGLVV